MVWVTLLLTAIGCIPYAGDVVKGALKAIIKGADDVALMLVRKIGGDDVVRAISALVSKFDDSLPEIRKLIQKWAEEAAQKGSPNASAFFARMDEMIDSAARLIRNKIDDFGRKVEKSEVIDNNAKNIPRNNGKWKGEPGYSKWIPDYNFIPKKCNPDNLTWEKICDKYKIKEIPFKSGEPDFSFISKGKVEIQNFSAKRYGKDGNFSLADELLAQKKGCTARDVANWRSKNRYTWHEQQNCKTLQKVPLEVHANISHNGGISVMTNKKGSGIYDD